MKKFFALLPLLLLSPASQASPSACEDYQPQRRAYYGDLHIHSSYSLDASTRMEARATPTDAYRFAQGEEIGLPPYDSAGKALRRLQIQRPLDFAAVTDHAEDFALVRICNNPELEGFDSWLCQHKSSMTGLISPLLKKVSRWFATDTLHPCGLDEKNCQQANKNVWADTLAAASEHNQPCQFTTFNAYEWSGTIKGGNMHRNVVFSNDAVLAVPVSAREALTVEALWAALDSQCFGEAGCQAITIPHNNNLSQGMMFSATMGNGEPMTLAVAKQRSRYERLAEIIQHKGDSECYFEAGFSEDELCNFEKLPYGSFIEKYAPFLASPPANDSRYMREALREGLRIEKQLGVNPFVPGFIGSTDTHIAAGGGVEENNYGGHHGAQGFTKDEPLIQQMPDRIEQNPGGLAVLYAEQNTRAALFAAMQRREAFGTSGPRIALRFFAGKSFPEDICQRTDLVAQGYDKGVPMGGELSADYLQQSPEFIVSAQQDASSVALQRLQIIKAWVDDQGNSREQVFDVVGDVDNGASVDLSNCQPRGVGSAQLCAQWQDPDFDSSQSAYYYARAVENPSCRWQAHICVAQKVDCGSPDNIPEGLQVCCDSSVPKTIQERAWSSPIWYRSEDL